MNAKDTIEIQIGFGMDLSPRDTEELLGVVPKEGMCEFGQYQLPDKELFYNMERTFGTYVRSALTRSIGDCWGLDVNKPVLDRIETHGSYKEFFYVVSAFAVPLTFASSDAAEQLSNDDLKLMIEEIENLLPLSMTIVTVTVHKS